MIQKIAGHLLSEGLDYLFGDVWKFYTPAIVTLYFIVMLLYFIAMLLYFIVMLLYFIVMLLFSLLCCCISLLYCCISYSCCSITEQGKGCSPTLTLKSPSIYSTKCI